MSRVQMTQAVAADYADAMLVARRAKNVLFFFLILVLLIQLGAFFLVRYVPVVKIRTEPAAISATEMPATAPSVTVASTNPLAKWNWPRTLRFWISAGDFLAIVLSFALPIVLLLVIGIMLVGRLVGVSHVTSAFCWSIVFLVILFPWQTLLSGHGQENSTPGMTSATATDSVPGKAEITFPGVLYTFTELSHDYDFPSTDWKYDWANLVLKWMRFVGWPVVEIIILLMVQGRSSRGLRFALGEADVPVDVGLAS